MDDDFRFPDRDRVSLAKIIGGEHYWESVNRIERSVGAFLARRGQRAEEASAERMRDDITLVRDRADNLMAALEAMHEECEHILETGADSRLYSMLSDVHTSANWFLHQRFKRGVKVDQIRHDLENHVAVLVGQLRLPTRGPRFESILRLVAKAATGRAPLDMKKCATHAREAIKSSHRSASDFPAELKDKARAVARKTGR
jgi:hypothetical protein